MRNKTTKEKTMKLYRFKATTGMGMALTDDKSGAKLPKRKFGAWAFDKEMNISAGDGPLIGADSDQIIKGIERDGYFLWPQKDQTDEKKDPNAA
jgi:hypothetical protein